MLHVLVPSFNCAPWIERCLQSVVMQDVAPDQVLVFDDASTDEEYAPLVQRLCRDFGFNYYRNAVNHRCPRALRGGINLLGAEDEDVIFLLDGDDFLPHSEVFSRVMREYVDPEVWLTYGNFTSYPDNTGETPASQYPTDIIFDRDFRYESHFFDHPLTFRKFLWDGVTDEDMQEQDGTWFDTCYDQVIMIPMLEMAGGRHYRFINEVLYVYNTDNPLSEVRVFDGRSPMLVDRPKKKQLYR